MLYIPSIKTAIKTVVSHYLFFVSGDANILFWLVPHLGRFRNLSFSGIRSLHHLFILRARILLRLRNLGRQEPWRTLLGPPERLKSLLEPSALAASRYLISSAEIPAVQG